MMFQQKSFCENQKIGVRFLIMNPTAKPAKQKNK